MSSPDKWEDKQKKPSDQPFPSPPRKPTYDDISPRDYPVKDTPLTEDTPNEIEPEKGWDRR